ncbi:MAG: hypothetical protein ACTSRG_21250 [Candidatus Helarchaeota archaeon]
MVRNTYLHEGKTLSISDEKERIMFEWKKKEKKSKLCLIPSYLWWVHRFKETFQNFISSLVKGEKDVIKEKYKNKDYYWQHNFELTEEMISELGLNMTQLDQKIWKKSLITL